MNLYLEDRIGTALYELTNDIKLTSIDKIRRAALIEAYLFVLGYFKENQKINEVTLFIPKKFLWINYFEKESYIDSMIRHGYIFLKNLN